MVCSWLGEGQGCSRVEVWMGGWERESVYQSTAVLWMREEPGFEWMLWKHCKHQPGDSH